jgi:hypothetical protein
MQKVRRLRAMGSVCRQLAAYNPDPAQSGELIAEAVYWEHLAEAELAAHFQECNPTDLAIEREAANLNEPRLQAIDVA